MGIDIDREIAEKVMGLTKAEAGAVLVKDLPEYSTNIAHAFEVVEKVCEGPGMYEFMLWKYTSGWEAGFSRHIRGNQPEMFTEIAETPAMAICLAALEATKDG